MHLLPGNDANLVGMLSSVANSENNALDQKIYL